MGWFTKIKNFFKRSGIPVPFSYKGKKYMIVFENGAWAVKDGNGNSIGLPVFGSSDAAKDWIIGRLN